MRNIPVMRPKVITALWFLCGELQCMPFGSLFSLFETSARRHTCVSCFHATLNIMPFALSIIKPGTLHEMKPSLFGCLS